MSDERPPLKDIAEGQLKERERSASKSSQVERLDERLEADSKSSLADVAVEKQPRNSSGRSSQERAAIQAASNPYEREPPWRLPINQEPTADIVRKPVPGERRIQSEGDAPQTSVSGERKRPLPARYRTNRPVSPPVSRPVISSIPKPIPTITIPKRKPVPPRKDAPRTPHTPQTSTPIIDLQRSPARRLTNQDRPRLGEGGSGRPRSSTAAPLLRPWTEDTPEPKRRTPFMGGDTPDPSIHLSSMERSVELSMPVVQPVERRHDRDEAIWWADATPRSTYGSISNIDTNESKTSSLHGAYSFIAAEETRPSSPHGSFSNIVDESGLLKRSEDAKRLDAIKPKKLQRRSGLRGGGLSSDSTSSLSPKERRELDRANITRLLTANARMMTALAEMFASSLQVYLEPGQTKDLRRNQGLFGSIQIDLQRQLALLDD